MKIFLAQQNYQIGDFQENLKKMIRAVEQAKKQHADMLVFSELCVCGYPPKDLLLLNGSEEKGMASIHTLKGYTDDLAIVVGAPHRLPLSEGGTLFNSAYFLYGREIRRIVNKTSLSASPGFNEFQYFKAAERGALILFKGGKLAITIGEERWHKSESSLDEIFPSKRWTEEQPDLLIHLSAAAFDYNRSRDSLDAMKRYVEKYHSPLIYCNAVGAQTAMIFHGGSFFMDADGEIQKALPLFKEAVGGCVFEENKGKSLKKIPKEDHKEVMGLLHFYNGSDGNSFFHAEKNIDLVHGALVLGMKDYFQKLHLKKAVIGLSGGIDSAVVLSLACSALGNENVYVLLMPSPYSSEHSVSDAELLAENLHVSYDIIAIGDLFNHFLQTIHPLFGTLPTDTAEENIQARLRGNLLMAVANKFGYILLNTSNKSELAVGYGTLYGDLAGGISVLGDLYKSQVFALAKYINREKEILPNHILTKAPSAELHPGQKDSDNLPDYDTLDTILYEYINKNNTIENIQSTTKIALRLIEKVIEQVNKNEYKRHQFCPVLSVSNQSFGLGRRMPIVAKLFPVLIPIFYLFFDIF